MKKKIAFALILLLCPTIGLAGGHGYTSRYYSGGPQGHYRSAPPYPGVGRPGYPYHGSHHHHHDDWILPLAIFGTALGIMALSSRPYPPPQPLPPRRICRDTYNHYDEYGRYLYSTYVDRPCD